MSGQKMTFVGTRTGSLISLLIANFFKMLCLFEGGGNWRFMIL